MYLTEEERILMMGRYGNNVKSYKAVAALFNNTFPYTLISKCTIQRIVSWF